MAPQRHLSRSEDSTGWMPREQKHPDHQDEAEVQSSSEKNSICSMILSKIGIVNREFKDTGDGYIAVIGGPAIKPSVRAALTLGAGQPGYAGL